MRLFLSILLWLAVFSFSPLLAVAALVLFPIVWLVSLPFRLFACVIEAALGTLKGIIFLLMRLLGMLSSKTN